MSKILLLLISSIVDHFLAECKHLRRLRLPCLTPYVVKRTGKRRAKDSDIDKQRIEGGGVSFSDEVFRKWALKYKDSLAELEVRTNLIWTAQIRILENLIATMNCTGTAHGWLHEFDAFHVAIGGDIQVSPSTTS